LNQELIQEISAKNNNLNRIREEHIEEIEEIQKKKVKKLKEFEILSGSQKISEKHLMNELDIIRKKEEEFSKEKKHLLKLKEIRDEFL